MDTISPKDRQILDSLKKAVADALERKRLLGQYAVIWKDGQVVTLRGNDLLVKSGSSSSTKTQNQPLP
ncbi:MAG: hypothetical protein HQL94_06875 [Magnetococcales bacterium]|nr:hypothetical protein [Magnetococcales bacterium]MBF0439545.1 hypothetical protein [Magnetococcales bacterium]